MRGYIALRMRSELPLRNAWIYKLSDRVEFVNGQKTITASWSDDYPYQVRLSHPNRARANDQKLTALAPAMDLIAIGTTDNRVSILRYPSLESVAPVIELKSELVDLHWGGKEGKWVSLLTRHFGLQLTSSWQSQPQTHSCYMSSLARNWVHT
jgi:hypothetical protein